jgi:hypothetical protein
MELLPKDFVPELNTKNLGNSTSFLTITHMTLSTKRFIRYRILMIDVTAEICSWTDQRQNGSSISGLGLAETPEVPNTVSKGNSHLSDGPINGSNRLAICELRQSETRPVAKTIFLADHTFLYKIGFGEFRHDLPESSHT